MIQSSQGSQTEGQRSTSKARKPAQAATIIYVPLNLGGSHAGVAMGPAAIRVTNLKEQIKKIGLETVHEVYIDVPRFDLRSPSSDSQTGKGLAHFVAEIAEVSKLVASAVEEAMDQGSIPITVGGDHSLAIGSLAGVSGHYRKNKQQFGLVWFDAHGDINTPETSHSGNVHGMPFAVSLGYGDERLTHLNGFAPKVPAERACLIGLRDLDAPERKQIADWGVQAFTMREIDHLGVGKVIDLSVEGCGLDVAGIHVSFDIDSIDPDIAPGVSTPSRGGLTYRESHLSLELLCETGLVRSMDFVELNPAKDVRNGTAELACELILSCLGKRIL